MKLLTTQITKIPQLLIRWNVSLNTSVGLKIKDTLTPSISSEFYSRIDKDVLQLSTKAEVIGSILLNRAFSLR
jgi:hypothetical protein